jgi:hypothetical protein
MGLFSKKSKKTKVSNETTTDTKLVKLSYIQTLAVSQELTSAEALTETSASESSSSTNSGNSSLKSLIEGVLAQGSLGGIKSIFGFGTKKKVKTSVEATSTGIQVKDQCLQPYFDRIRYGIGIKELSVSRFKFETTSEMISVPYFSPKEIVKVHIAVDEYIPKTFDQTKVWIEYYIKSEGQSDWVRINPLDAPTRHSSDGSIVPKIINFNLPKPTTSKLEDKYNYTEEPIKKLRFRAVLSRPTGGNNDSITPMLKSYRLMLIPRQ